MLVSGYSSEGGHDYWIVKCVLTNLSSGRTVRSLATRQCTKCDDNTMCLLCRNTWSSYWGEDGYVRMARQPADCGIATDPIYVDLELA